MRRRPHNPHYGASSDDIAARIFQIVVAAALAAIACLTVLH
jgi:hypothetical protein